MSTDIRVLYVTAAGAEAGWNVLAQAVAEMRPGGFISIDTEFSGLCSRSRLEDPDLALRYEAFRVLASKREVLSLGISLFNPVKPAKDATDSETAPLYDVTNLEFLLKCSNGVSISTDTGAFLVKHGFDFNALFTHGIPYERAGASTTEGSAFAWGPYPRGLLWRLGRAGVPIVVHNGVLDLVLLYSSFHAPLPPTLGEYVSALVDALPAGVYDTKLLASGPGEEARSFLAYVYARAVLAAGLRVRERANLPPACVVSPPEPPPADAPGAGRDELCLRYAANGACARSAQCGLVHDPFALANAIRDGKVSADQKKGRDSMKRQIKSLKKVAKTAPPPKLNKKAKKRLRAAEKERALGNASDDVASKRPRRTDAASCALPVIQGEENGAEKSEADARSALPNTKAHSAGWDAFCTAYAFASYKNRLSEIVYFLCITGCAWL
eukprot:IDg8327t1